ncbi:MAG: hypothetical protein IPK66_03560 [Rhodospirillales bacterium]|nr:hypothetical protein [Rhodospirillales bacterium]
MTTTNLEQLLEETQRVRARVADEGETILSRWRAMPNGDFDRDGMGNLAHYLSFRTMDLRPLQKSLVAVGLLGLGRCESRVMPTLDSVLANLDQLTRKAGTIERPSVEAFWSGMHCSSARPTSCWERRSKVVRRASCDSLGQGSQR